MKKLDRRIVRTRQKLANALITLALEHGYDNLTVKAVTAHADVGYNTFYRHYLNLDELLVEILWTAYKRLLARVAQATTPDGEVLAMYTFISEHPDVLRVYINLPWEHPARQVIVSDAVKLMYARYAQQNTSSAPLDISIDHLLMATNNLVAWYLDHLDDYTPEQAAVMHNTLVGKALEHKAINLQDDWMQKRQGFI